MADVFAAVWAGAVHLLHGHLDWLALQLFIDTADREELLRIASLYGIVPIPATFASGAVIATGVTGNSIPSGAILRRTDGVTYRATAAATITSGTATVLVEAVAAGSNGNLAEGQTLTFESPLAGVNASTLTAPGGISNGFNEEPTEGTRARLLLRLREPPQGGTEPDYRLWARVAGVTRVWVFANELGLGTVVVRIVTDGQTPIFPSPATVAAAQAAIDAQRPITAAVTAAAPTPLAIDFQIAASPNTPSVQAAIAAELTDLLFRDAEPGNGLGRGAIRRSRILTAIGVAEGVADFSLISPTADVVPGTGELAVLGTVSFSAL